MDRVNRLVVIIRVVMKEIERLDARVNRIIDHVYIAGMPPAALDLVILGRVLRVVDQDVGAFDGLKLVFIFLAVHRLEQGLLFFADFVELLADGFIQKLTFVIGDIDHGLLADPDPVAVGNAGVMHVKVADIDGAVMDFGMSGIEIVDIGHPALGADRKVGRPHL